MNRTDRLHPLPSRCARPARVVAPADQLAGEFDVTSRTIKRNLGALEAGGFASLGTDRSGRRLRTGGTVVAAAGQLHRWASVGSLCRGGGLVQAPFSEAARTAARKMLDVLDLTARRRATDLSRRVWSTSAERSTASAVRVRTGLHDQVTVNLSYCDAHGRKTRREVEPMTFALTAQG